MQSDAPRVSIQLVSPASGDSELRERGMSAQQVSIQLVSPASGDRCKVQILLVVFVGFPFN